MKFIFYMLVLINIGFYLWESGTQTAPTQEVEPQEGSERIVLLKEIPGRLKAQEIKPDISQRCYLLGPFPSEPIGHAALDNLRPHLTKIDLTFRSGDAPIGFWVLYPKADSVEAAKLNRKMLMDQGIKDVWLFDKGELQNAISLGFFDTKEAAEAMKQKFNERKIVTEIKPRMLKSEAFWLQMDWSGPKSELEALINKTSPPISQKLKACD